jgi:hypothetical protein
MVAFGVYFRTVAQLHPLQLATRVPHRLIETVVRAVGLSAHRGPLVKALALREEARRALAEFELNEAERFEGRREWLRGNPNLEAYECRYALDLPRAEVNSLSWTDGTSLAPYVASVRARRLASGIARGRVELAPHLVRSARAVVVAPELHLLGNHLLENGIGLVCASAVAEGKEADVWWSVGSAILNWQLPLQFYADGMHDEGSMTYHLWLVAGLAEAVVLADAAGRAVPPLWTEIVERGVGIALDYEAPDGRYPLFNDAAFDAAPSIAQTVSLARACGFYVRSARTEPAFTSEVGWVVLRNARAWCVMKAGPDGSPTQPGHVHADLLSIELWVDGEKRISDPGVTSYNDDAARAWCRSSAAHNGPHFEGENTSEVWAAFRTGKRASATTESVEAKPERLVCRAARPCGASTVRRTLTLDKGSLAVDDRVDGVVLGRLGAPPEGWQVAHASPVERRFVFSFTHREHA